MIFDESKLCRQSDWFHDLSAVKNKSHLQSAQGVMSPQEIVIVKDLKHATVYSIDEVLEELSEENVDDLDWHYKIFLD